MDTALHPRESALATFGHATAAETIAAAARWRARATDLYSPPAGMTFAEYRDTVTIGDGRSDVPAEDDVVAGVPVRIVRPPQSGAARPPQSGGGVLLHIHGGGWCLGSHRTQDGRLAALAEATGAVVVSVGYRMAPEHPFPACLDDCVAVASALDAAAVAGESAGAHLAVLTMAAAGAHRFRAALLTFGSYDLGSPAVRRVVPLAFPDAETRSASPLFADLTGMPPACFVVGTRDPLLADTLMMEARWRTVADTELHIAAGAEHAFTLDDLAVTAQAEDAGRAFLRRMASNRW